jgi:hypothetical protein
VVSVAGKGGTRFRQVRCRETSVSEPLTKCRKRMDDVETGRMSLARDKSGGGLIAVRMTSGMQGGVTLHLALARNVGTCRPDAKGEVQAGGPREDESTEAGHRGGATRSRVEGSVIGLDRRGCVVRLWNEANQQWEEPRE